MVQTVYLDRQLGLLAVEVQHKVPEGVLTAEFGALFARTEQLPETDFRFRGVLALLAGEVDLVAVRGLADGVGARAPSGLAGGA